MKAYDKYVEYWRDLEIWLRWSFEVTENGADGQIHLTCTVTWNAFDFSQNFITNCPESRSYYAKIITKSSTLGALTSQTDRRQTTDGQLIS